MRGIFLHIIFIIASFHLEGQVSIGLSTQQDTFEIGDLVKVQVKINVDDPGQIDKIDFSPMFKIENPQFAIDSTGSPLQDIAVIDGGPWKVTMEQPIFQFDKNTPLEGTITMSFYDMNRVLLNNPIVITKAQSSVVELESPELIILWPEELTQQDSIQTLPMKNIIEQPWSPKSLIPLLIIILGLILMTGVFYWVKKRFVSTGQTITANERPEPKIPAHIKAMEALKILADKNLWQQGLQKEYHSELTAIMRIYLEDRYKFPAMERTTSEIINALSDLGVGGETISQFQSILTIADQIKFAKGQADATINEQFLKDAQSIILKTKIEEADDQ